MSASYQPGRPASAYRVQLHPGFGFRAAGSLVPYLRALGVDHFYGSPYFRPHPGSRHGYDICDFGRLNPELGTAADYDAFCAELRRHGLGQIVDFVPNHMAADARENAWWRDVLENGPSSPYAAFFDIDWDPVKPELKGKVLLPVLGRQYGDALEAGELQLRLEAGALHLQYYDRDLPINPRQSPRVLGLDLDRLERQLAGDPALREFLSILTALNNLPPYTESDAARVLERQREKEVARERLATLLRTSAPIRDHVEACVCRANGRAGDRASFDSLHDLLERQAYRLAYWRTASDEINYRRFFDINELVALRMENPAVFEATHGLLRRLIDEQRVDGVRIDHPDGLYDPATYFARLQTLASRPLFVVAEKILSADESLRAEWPIAGTTGYGFLNAATGLFIDPRQVGPLRRLYARITGRQEPFREIAYQGRRTIMLTALASELNVLAHALNRISERDRRSRDFTLDTCRAVLREVVACFPVYRSYISGRGASPFDRAVIGAALAEARRRNPVMEASIFDFLESVLLGGGGDGAAPPAEHLHFAMKLQQFTAPVQAKGVEDTAFYRHHVLIAANEVGGDAGTLSTSVAAFHEMNRRRLEQWPLELAATSTHDTKRGEDARARIDAVSELVAVWSRGVGEWFRVNGRNRTRVAGAWVPDRNDEYLFYQALVGAWPCEAPDAAVPARAEAALVSRLSAFMQKATREAKVHTSWINEDPDFTRAVARFVEATLAGRSASRFLGSFVPVVRRLARVGAVNGLAQLALKLGSPGVPDVYQGSELWNLSLVDPDNRVDVDFERQRAMLADLQPLIERVEAGCSSEAAAVADLAARWHDGRIKMLVTALGLRFRRWHRELLLAGGYEPLQASGPRADHIVAFARRDQSGTLVIAVPRLVAELLGDGHGLAFEPAAWGDTAIGAPSGALPPTYRCLLTGEALDPGTAAMWRARDLFGRAPVALLWGPAASA